jgi:uroporphyrinogen-III synthase
MDDSKLATHILTGKRILITRAADASEHLSTLLKDLGADVVHLPAIRFMEAPDYTAFDRAMLRLNGFDWAVFPSPAAVDFTFRRMNFLKTPPSALVAVYIAAMGPGTANALTSRGMKVDFIPKTSLSESFVEELAAAGNVLGKIYIVFRSSRAGDGMAKLLLENGAAAVEDIIAYRTENADPLDASLVRAIVEEHPPDAVAFTSASTVEGCFAALGEGAERVLRRIKKVTIGPKTSAALRNAGLEPDKEATRHDLDGLVSALKEVLV